MFRAVRDVIFLVWGLSGITYLVLTGAVSGALALPVFATAAGITAIPAILRAREAGAEVKKIEAEG